MQCVTFHVETNSQPEKKSLECLHFQEGPAGYHLKYPTRNKYAVFCSAENKRRTKHIPRTLNPEWNETVTFPNVHIEELKNKMLEITVWDYDRFKTNDFLGEVVLDLAGK